jgi:glycosyltransferase involved in cell wall biosynthesis
MKVGVFLENFSPAVGGGYTIQADVFRSLLDLAHESRHTFAVLCQRPEELAGQLKSNIEAVAFPGALVTRVVSKVTRSLSQLGNRKALQNRLEQIALQERIDFIWFVGAEAIHSDVPYSAIVWDLQHRLQPWFPETSAHGEWEHREAFYSKFLRRAALIITGTAAGKNEIENFYGVPADRIMLLPHPTPRFALEAETQAGSDVLARYGLERGYLFYPAQFWPHKNHANLLFALARLRDQHKLALDVVLVGADKGNQSHICALAKDLGIREQLHILGFVSIGDLIGLYREALALTYLSFFGPENLPPLEAFALGCPVIAANVSGASEQLGDAALLVNPRDEQEIAAAIKKLYDDPDERAALICRGQRRARLSTADDFVRGIFSFLDQFESTRRCWRS